MKQPLTSRVTYTLAALTLSFLITTQAPAETRQRKLKDVDIYLHIKKPIHEQPNQWLIKHFNKRADEFPVNLRMMVRNIIWQQRNKILSGEKPPLNRNIRSFYYQYIKVPCSRLEIPSKSAYEALIDTLAYLVQDKKLMKYKDIGFADEGKESRHIGRNHHIILIAEKEGWSSFLKKMHKKYNITTIYLGGQPSQLEAEYFVDDMRSHNINLRQKFYLFPLVDYDPSGWIIKNAFLDDLKLNHINRFEVIDVIHPDNLDVDEIQLKAIIPPINNMETQNRNWMGATGGINGQLYSLEVEAFSDVVETLLDKKIKPLLKEKK
jgi:hypothetical protein